ncbi:E-selectin-like [Garra rufa]|uniref:E-selectin-like n=1 Tax=Garra rufa TaxID=137080 RepID=UPI003CCE6DD7
MDIFNKVPLQFFASLVLIYSALNIWSGTEGWSYHYSDSMMNWESARDWCRQRFTDMVAIQNKEEINHLNSFLPKVSGYYWIGIRKINDNWTWVGTNKTLTKEAENWAEKEPNNGGNHEDCVEIYIKREKDEGKWNDESCYRKKTALCYTAACKVDSCVSGHGECVETINDHKCSCFDGFYGERCEHVVKCKPEDITPLDYASIDCSHPNGNFSYASQCKYSCEKGYKLKGSSTTTCTSTTKWSSKPPTCELVQCPELNKPQEGEMQCQNPMGNFRYQSTCEFMCDEGYTLRDSSSSTLFCEATGHWNDSQPTCEIVKCKPEDVTPPDHASVQCSYPNGNFSYDSQCEYSCKEGYKLKGSSTTTCTSTTEWSSKPPTCELVQCPELNKPQEGEMQCQNPMGNFRYQSTCEFKCKKGYTLRDSSSSTLFCKATGHWNDSQPTCEIVKCKPEDVTPPDHATVQCSYPNGNFSYDSQCKYSCKEGYKLKGSSMTRCTSTTEWSSKPPTCELVRCPELNKPQEGEMQCQNPMGNFSYQSTCEFKCEKGYTLRNSSSSTLFCEAIGHWNDSQPTCEIVKCEPEDVTPPDHATVQCSYPNGNFSYDSRCEYSCEEGYELKGSSTTTCTSTTEWSSKPPTCELVQCPELNKPQKGKMQCQNPMGNFRYQSTCEFMCEKGYTLRNSNSSTLFCGATGSWNDSQPTCEIVQCKPEDVSPPDHASVQCSYPNGNFSYDSQCKYSCEEGYELKGSSTTTCTSTTEWSSKAPTCELIHCPALNSPVNGELSCTSSSNYGSKCSFSCVEGFRLQGASEISCTKTAKWSQEPPRCEAVVCPQLPEPINGYMNCSSEEPTFGTFCIFICDEGQLLEEDSDKIMMCNSNGSWSGEVAVCQAHPDTSASLLEATEVTVGVAGAISASSLGLVLWILKKLRKKASNFDLNSTLDIEDPPQSYKNSIDSLI